MLRRAIAVGALSVALLQITSGQAASAGDNPVAGASCKIRLATTRESHRARFSSECNFEQSSIRINAGAFIEGVDPTLELSGNVDPGDGFSCGKSSDRIALCQGRAGSGANVAGHLVTRQIDCEVSTRIRITGGVDCDQGDVCPEIAFVVRKRFVLPQGC